MIPQMIAVPVLTNWAGFGDVGQHRGSVKGTNSPLEPARKLYERHNVLDVNRRELR